MKRICPWEGSNFIVKYFVSGLYFKEIPHRLSYKKAMWYFPHRQSFINVYPKTR